MATENKNVRGRISLVAEVEFSSLQIRNMAKVLEKHFKNEIRLSLKEEGFQEDLSPEEFKDIGHWTGSLGSSDFANLIKIIDRDLNLPESDLNSDDSALVVDQIYCKRIYRGRKTTKKKLAKKKK